MRIGTDGVDAAGHMHAGQLRVCADPSRAQVSRTGRAASPSRGIMKQSSEANACRAPAGRVPTGCAHPRRPWRTVVLLSALVLLVSFLGSAIFTKWHALDAVAHAQTVSANALPSVVHLAGLRAEVRTVERDLGQAVRQKRSPAPQLEALDAELAAYRALPVFQDEEDEWNEASEAVTRFRRDISRVEQCIAEGNWTLAVEVLEAAVEPSAHHADYALTRVIDLNIAHANSAATSIEMARRRITGLGAALDVASIVVVVAAVFFAVRTVRRYTHLIEERSDELEQFAARVAHDIRGPLGVPLFALQTIANSSESDSNRRMSQRGLRGLQRVVDIVDALFRFASAGAPDPDARANVRDAIRGVLQDVEEMAGDRRVHLRVDEDRFPDVEVACAPGTLVSIVSNLVRNAIKYIGDGPIRDVTVRVGESEATVRVEVEDTGPGIPESLKTVVFEPYVRGRRNGAEGLGLGLATVKRLVQAHTGAAGVESRVSGGSLFWFELPTALPRTRLAQQTAEQPVQADDDVSRVH
jgi:signal transduction histidine kinase